MKLSKSVSAMHDFVEQQNLKEEKARKKREMKDADEQEEAERLKQEAKEARAAEKARKCAEEQKKAADAERERRAQMKKDVDLSVTIRISEMEDSRFQRLHTARGPSSVMPLRKTPGRPRTIKSPVKTQLSDRKTPKTPKMVMAASPLILLFTPVTRGALERLRHRNKIIDELKTLDAVELQKLCKKEGVPYNGKIESILDIADVRAMMKFGTATQESAEVICVEESEDLADGLDRGVGSDDVVA
ncbi:hypothetical protein CBR_g39288 [Chara braunii]|uniref:Uncharacterized protein n=1 Tax=Chara braunii TaxID=69332 RepID=A0A388K111_CHABU|nr:hypothetical protein CBR_g39288 [Chara braunii]|eukprot:GBG63744.1 hypothetical protein CBR_g39288 [Chara braunii]